MFTLVRKFVLVALLLLVPLQGFAAAVGPVICASTHDAHHGMQTGDDAHEHAAHQHDASHSDDKDTSGGSDTAKHFECHHVFSGVPVGFQASAPSAPPIFRSTLSPLATLHIPESPQRPPRS